MTPTTNKYPFVDPWMPGSINTLDRCNKAIATARQHVTCHERMLNGAKIVLDDLLMVKAMLKEAKRMGKI